MRSSREGENRE